MITFAEATTKDIPLLQQLAREIWYAHYPSIISLQQIEYMLNHMYGTDTIESEMAKGYQWRIIMYDPQPVGFLSFHFEQSLQKVKLDKLYLNPAWHKKGIGQQALQFVIDQARKLNAKAVYLTVNKKNEKAIAAYLKAGFFIDHSEKFDIGQGFFMDDYVMQFNL